MQRLCLILWSKYTLLVAWHSLLHRYPVSHLCTAAGRCMLKRSRALFVRQIRRSIFLTLSNLKMATFKPSDILLLLITTIFSLLQLSSAQRTPNENLVLADCGIGLGVNGGSTSREMIYYPGDVWTGQGLQTNRPTMMVNVPWTGAYPWGQQGGVSARMPNGDVFTVHINTNIKDPMAAGDAWHLFEMNFPLKCYSYHYMWVYKLDDGKWCESAYVCNHRGTPTPHLKSAPAPGPATAPNPRPPPICDVLNN